MNKNRKLTDTIFKFSDKDVYKCAMLNLNECLSKNECIHDKCDRYNFCAGNNLSHINLYVEKLETALNEIKEETIKWDSSNTCAIDDYYFKEKILQIIDKVGGNE